MPTNTHHQHSARIVNDGNSSIRQLGFLVSVARERSTRARPSILGVGHAVVLAGWGRPLGCRGVGRDDSRELRRANRRGPRPAGGTLEWKSYSPCHAHSCAPALLETNPHARCCCIVYVSRRWYVQFPSLRSGRWHVRTDGISQTVESQAQCATLIGGPTLTSRRLWYSMAPPIKLQGSRTELRHNCQPKAAQQPVTSLPCSGHRLLVRFFASPETETFVSPPGPGHMAGDHEHATLRPCGG